MLFICKWKTESAEWLIDYEQNSVNYFNEQHADNYVSHYLNPPWFFLLAAIPILEIYFYNFWYVYDVEPKKKEKKQNMKSSQAYS